MVAAEAVRWARRPQLAFASAARQRGPAVFALPVVAVLALTPLGTLPALRSVERGAQEVLSATARGSLPDGAAARLAELASTFGLAALPLIVLAFVGVALVLKQSAMLRFVYAPAAVYLIVVFALVAGGAYTGSHRYLYPALPALALLAAAALDRQPAITRLAAAGATAPLALAFLPLFNGFAGAAAGLLAAGRAASGRPGVLATDSPLVAYYSPKKTAGITSAPRMAPAPRPASGLA